MLSKPIAVAFLVIACVSAAAGGAYLAVRHTDTAALSASEAPAAPLREPAAPAVEATEAIIETPAPGAEAEAEAFEPSPVAPRTTRPSAAPAPRAAPPRTPAPAPAPAEARRTPPVRAEPIAPPSVPVELPEVSNVPVAAAPPEPPLPPLRFFEDLVIPASSVVGLQIQTPVTSERARLEDRVEARVQRDVTVDGRTAIPTGSRALGVVTLVERGGKLKERARLGVRFHTLVLADGTTLPIRTETIYRDGDSPGAESTRKIGGAAAGGAILGAIIGGKKGAAIGGATGAAGGTAVVMAGDRNPATLPVGSVVTIRLTEPLVVEVEQR